LRYCTCLLHLPEFSVQFSCIWHVCAASCRAAVCLIACELLRNFPFRSRVNITECSVLSFSSQQQQHIWITSSAVVAACNSAYSSLYTVLISMQGAVANRWTAGHRGLT
jgi:hypothetical protein